MKKNLKFILVGLVFVSIFMYGCAKKIPIEEQPLDDNELKAEAQLVAQQENIGIDDAIDTVGFAYWGRQGPSTGRTWFLFRGRRISFASCYDTDNGRDWYNAGRVTSSYSYFGRRQNTEYGDSCNGNTLTEYYCRGDRYSSIPYSCPNGCQDGACINLTGVNQLNQGQYNPGLRVYNFDYTEAITGIQRKIITAIWYPSNEPVRDFSYREIMPFKSKVAFESEIAPLAEGSQGYPLLIFSHGYSSSGYDTAIYSEYLASYGYIVVAPDYIDLNPKTGEHGAYNRIPEEDVYIPNRNPSDTRQISWQHQRERMRLLMKAMTGFTDMTSGAGDMSNYLENQRLYPTRFVLDTILTDQYFSQYIDQSKIGIYGQSMGTMTAMMLVGIHNDSTFLDERYKAVALLAPAAMPGVERIRIPISVVIGEADMIITGAIPGLERSSQQISLHPVSIYEHARPPKYYILLVRFMNEFFTRFEQGLAEKGMNTSMMSMMSMDHFAVTNMVALFTPLYEARENVPMARVVTEHLLAFFDKNLRGITEPDPIAEENLDKYVADNVVREYRINETAAEMQ